MLFMEELLNTTQAAQFLGVTVRSIQNYRKAGIIIPDSFGKDGSVLYSKISLIEGAKRWLRLGETYPKKQPKIAGKFSSLVKRYGNAKNYIENDRVQIYPITQRIVPSFKLCKVIFNLDQQKYIEMVIDGKTRRIVEKRNHKKFGTIFTTYRISNSKAYNNTDPLNEFDYAVFSVCVSYFDKGYPCITVAILYRALTGKGNTARVTPNLREAILQSLKKLIGTVIEIDESEVNSSFNYADSDHSKKCSAILPAHLDDKIINGQNTSVIYFDKESPLMEIARQRNQLLRYDVSLLNDPATRNTFINIMLKSYVIRRVTEIKAHKQLKPTLNFSDILKKCCIDAINPKIKSRACDTIFKLFQHLQDQGFIKSFKLVKEKNNSNLAMKFFH